MTASPLSPFRSPGAPALSLLLAFAVGLQALPLRSLVHHVQQTAYHASAHHECTHPKGYCPMNPDGPCRCDHDTTAPDVPVEPTLRSCSGPSTSGLPPALTGKWVPARSAPMPTPSVSPTSSRAARPDALSSQRAGDDVFRPPRSEADPRPASTLQASGSA